MKKSVYIFILMVGVQTVFAQQDPQYSQYMYNQLVINPAYTGSKEAISTVIDLRKQWIAMPGAPQTGSISMHAPLSFKSLGIGGHLITESIGPSKWTAVYADIAYRFKLRRGKLSFGISAGVVNYSMDVSKLDYKDANEPILNYTGARTKFDVNAGFYYYDQSFYLGGSVTHINQPHLYDATYTIPNTTAYAKAAFNLQPHYFLYAGRGFQVNENLVFSPSLMVKGVQGIKPSIDINCNFLLHNRVWLGASFRTAYGFVGLIQVYVTDKFKVGYSYDQGLNKIGIAGQSSHEVVLSYDFNIFKSKMLSPRYL